MSSTSGCTRRGRRKEWPSSSEFCFLIEYFFLGGLGELFLKQKKADLNPLFTQP